MNFYAPNGYPRPVRLCEATRRFAFESLHRRYGRETLGTGFVELDGEPGLEDMTDLEKYDISVRRIAERAPVRICEGERISGAATLGYAVWHRVPSAYKGTELFWSISHLTVGFGDVLRSGINGIRKRALDSLERYRGTEREAFARSCVSCLDSFEIWHGRYLDALRDRPGYRDNYENLLRVPFGPAESFYDAVQSLWFTFAFIRLCGNWPGIGRIDVLLGDYLEKDLREGRITLDEAREILAHFFIKGCEWINGMVVGSGDAQHYQNLVLGGTDADGRDVTNSVTYLVLDIIEELGISDFPTTVRIGRGTSDELVRRTAEVMRYGGGTLAVYNEDLIIRSLEAYGYSRAEACSFANDGCWEVQIPGATDFQYMPFDSLRILQKKTLRSYENVPDFPDFESLFDRFAEDLKESVTELCAQCEEAFLPGHDGGGRKWKTQMPCTVVSLFERGCVERGLSYLEGGPDYRIRSPHLGGLADTADSLLAIKKAVFDEKRLTLEELAEILRNDWEGHEDLRLFMKSGYEYYGNDNDEADAIAARILVVFADICDSLGSADGYRFPAGVSTFGRQLEWASERLASPHGRKAGDVLAANCSPTPGTDLKGATAVIRSYCKADLSRMVSGAALDIKLLPSNVRGEDGLNCLCSLIRGFAELGGFFMQPDIIDVSVLKDAQEHPDNYETLSVRISGWNARFVTLDRKWQDMVIEQNEH